MASAVNGAEWGWIAVPLAALGGAAVKGLGWLRRMERESGKASEYQRHSTEAVGALKDANAAKDAEIAVLRETIASIQKGAVR